MGRPKKKPEDIRVRIDVTISKDEAAKLEELSRITGLPKSIIISKMIREESLEEAINYGNLKKALENSVYTTSDNRQTENQSFEPEDWKEPEEEIEPHYNHNDWEEIHQCMEIAKSKWGLR